MADRPATTTLPPLPTELAEQLLRNAAAMGMDLATYLVYLEQHRLGRLDATLDSGLHFALREHDQSLRKLAQ
ncbi:MAG: hypothetical protein AB7K09_24795 [Planctomycetota bacterium]